MLQLTVNDSTTYSVSEDSGVLSLNEKATDCDIQYQPNGLVSILYKNKSYTAAVEAVNKTDKELIISLDGVRYSIAVQEPMDQLLASMGLDLKAMQKVEPIKAPMPGKVLKVLVEEGQQIAKGDGILVLEAMKMENVLKSAGDATVKAINVSEQTAVEKGQILIELE